MGKTNVIDLADSKPVTYKDMPESYQAAYRSMTEAHREFLDALPEISGMTERTLETVYILDEIRRKADGTAGRYEHIVPATIKRGENEPDSSYAAVTVKSAVRRMGLVTNSFHYLTKDIRDKKQAFWDEESESDRLGHITDARAYLFEAMKKAEQAENLCSLYVKKLNGSKEAHLLRAIFGERGRDDNDPFGQIRDKIGSLRKYLSAADDFSESKETDDLPDAVFHAVSLVCDFKMLLTLLVNVSMADRDVPHAEPVSIPDMEKSLAWPMQVTALRRHSGDDSLFCPVITEESTEEEKKRARLMNAMQDELAEIRYNPDNFTGYHVNHVTSGKVEYHVLGQKHTGTEKGEDGRDIECFDRIEEGPFRTREEAEKALEKVSHTLDPDASDYADVYEFPTEEFYTVIRNADGELASKVLYPSESRAMAVLYLFAKPSAYREWKTYVDGKEGSAADETKGGGEAE